MTEDKIIKQNEAEESRKYIDGYIKRARAAQEEF